MKLSPCILSSFTAAACSVCLIPSVYAGTALPAASEGRAHAPEPNWLTGENVSLGGVLFPHLHFQSVYGGTTADDVEHFGAGHHDPVSDGWTIQGFEFGASLRPTEWFEAYGTYHLFQDALTHDWDGEFEEWFGKIKNIPGGFEVRGGRYLNRFGFHNQTHTHGWDFVDNNLVNGRFLGDDGLYTIGGEVTWTLPVSWTSLISVSVGVVPEHEHHHEGHEHEETSFEAEGALFNDTVVVANWTNNWDYNDFHQFRFGASGAWGDNEFSKTSQVYGLHVEYQWRENGYEAGGSYFRWRTEGLLRHFDASAEHHHEHEEEHEEEHHDHAEHEEHEHEEEHHTESGSFTEFGIYSALAYGLDNGLEFGLRSEYVEGVADAGLDERFRVSPSVTYYINPQRTLYLRTQYNYDHSSDFGDEHSVWAQFGFNWGGPEVR
ncbi:hypothetical protein DES53_101826 [Roseimicrobium gellanilyticum]|uniref:OmpL-like beta-barrel porin-2 n=1 Tax=Roseimicrobium gellanilyticum TaxID=748857 RepID=A0A366HUS4_9BACT|nr:hypothetical protein [Roseimicrobium gellanilyticum]RBP48026.1 hypothetical protein DES53_101826 [Roseimicrobium gellanilyticum]